MSQYISTRGYGSLGEVASGDYAAIRAAQANDASKHFGQTNINKPGQSTGYPRVSGELAVRLIDYWRSAGAPYRAPTVNRNLINTFGGPAIFNTWVKDYEKLAGSAGSQIRAMGTFSGAGIIPDSASAALWILIDPVAVGMRSVTEVPSQWELMKESVKEEVIDLARRAASGGSDLLTYAKWGLLGIIGFAVYDRVRKR